VIHQLVIAELALGSLRDRRKTLAMLDSLPQAPVAQLSELRHMIEVRTLYSLGLGLTDVHLIASILMSSSTFLWTTDKPLRKIAEALRIHVPVR
jgi:predicted nucleic acid-binding protein